MEETLVAGHSKWANIKHKKAKTDAIKGRIFTKLAREIIVAARTGGADPSANFRLKIAIENAKSANMPNDNIQRAIQKGAGAGEGTSYEELRYEGYGPGGVAIIVEVMTDNRNRTAGDLRHLFDKFGGNLGQNGCVLFMFDKKGVIVIERTEDIDEDELMMEAIEAGAEDFSGEEEYFEILTEPADFSDLRKALESKGYNFLQAEVQMVPQTTTTLTDPKQVEQMNKLIDNIEDLDDVQNVYHNWEENE